MKKIRLAFLTAIVITVIVGSSLAATRLLNAAPAAPPQDPVFTYTAKWICNLPVNQTFVNPSAAESIGLVPGEYKTDINVHNPGPAPVTIVKKFVLSVAEQPSLPTANFTAFAQTLVGPDVAFYITCDEIQSLLKLPPLHAFKGFAILFTNVANLDVVAEYTSQAFDFSPECPSPLPGTLTSTNCVEGLTLDVQKITAEKVPLVCTPSSTISASPASLIIQKGFNGTAIISITNGPCTTITECPSVTITPSLNGGPIAFIVPPNCVTLLPGQPTAATLLIVVPLSAPSGLYIITVTYTCGTCIPPLIQTAIITLRVP